MINYGIEINEENFLDIGCILLEKNTSEKFRRIIFDLTFNVLLKKYNSTGVILASYMWANFDDKQNIYVKWAWCDNNKINLWISIDPEAHIYTIDKLDKYFNIKNSIFRGNYHSQTFSI